VVGHILVDREPVMENSIYLALANQAVLRRELEFVAVNLANVNTTGYKASQPMFREFLRQAGADRPLSYVQDYGEYRDTRSGTLKSTNNPFDLAIKGPGYFAIQTPFGERYTRAGTFTLDKENRVVTQDGHALLGANNQGIVIPPGAAERVRIVADGTVLNGVQVIAQVKVVGFRDDNALSRSGDGLYVSQQAPAPAPQAVVVQGALEESNVVAINQLTRMTELVRAFQSTSRVVETEHERQRDAIRRLGRPPGQ
jgi:flagellar basal-body rod protein FlgF